ncbi:MAG: YHS domain-containing protein [Armatimonadota bacterium]|nr:YHS domain-containing protein [bacterium]
MMVTDPVCMMEIRKEDVKFTSEYRGQTYYFESDHCRRVFEDNPDEYVGVIPEKVYGDHGRRFDGSE